MKLIKFDDYQIKVADEAMLVRPIRKLFHQDRSQGKEQFYKQMSILYFVYSPTSNYSYIVDEKDRLKEVCLQENIENFKPSADFKAAVEIYKKLVKTTASELLEDVRLNINKLREALNSVNYSDFDDAKDKVNAINTVAAVLQKLPRLVKDLADAENAVAKEQEEQNNTRGSQELTVGDIWAEQGI
jgi:hypothetical protein